MGAGGARPPPPPFQQFFIFVYIYSLKCVFKVFIHIITLQNTDFRVIQKTSLEALSDFYCFFPLGRNFFHPSSDNHAPPSLKSWIRHCSYNASKGVIHDKMDRWVHICMNIYCALCSWLYNADLQNLKDKRSS